MALRWKSGRAPAPVGLPLWRIATDDSGWYFAEKAKLWRAQGVTGPRNLIDTSAVHRTNGVYLGPRALYFVVDDRALAISKREPTTWYLFKGLGIKAMFIREQTAYAIASRPRNGEVLVSSPAEGGSTSYLHCAKERMSHLVATKHFVYWLEGGDIFGLPAS